MTVYNPCAALVGRRFSMGPMYYLHVNNSAIMDDLKIDRLAKIQYELIHKILLKNIDTITSYENEILLNFKVLYEKILKFLQVEIVIEKLSTTPND